MILVELMGPDDLGGFLARKPPGFDLGRARALAWILDLLRALEHLHDRDPILIHRDVKPENLLLTRDRRSLKLADFGLAKAVRRAPSARAPSAGGVVCAGRGAVTAAKRARTDSDARQIL